MSEPDSCKVLMKKIQEIVHLMYEYFKNPETTVLEPLFRLEMKHAKAIAKAINLTTLKHVEEIEKMAELALIKPMTKDQFEKFRRSSEKLIFTLKEL